MIVRVSELTDDGVVVEGPSAFPAPFPDPAWRLDGVRLTVTPDGRDVTIQGQVSATVPQTCGRCAESFPVPVVADVDLRMVPRPAGRTDEVELGADDLDVDFYDGDEIDLGRVLATETTLALPMKPLCRAECRGLCPVCGANRNTVACGCAERAPDPRLAGLGALGARLRS